MRRKIKDYSAKCYNKLSQALQKDVKIFFIGFNKTATVSMHHLMERHAIRSIHWREYNAPDAPNLTLEIEKRLADPTALKGYMSRWTAFSDFHYVSPDAWVEGNRHFRIFDQLFQRSFFVLNDRDTDDWITSRLRHEKGMLLACARSYFGASEAEVIAVWRAGKERHTKAVLEHFHGRERFLHYRIDVDPPAKLRRFLSPVFMISTKRWPHAHKTPEA